MCGGPAEAEPPTVTLGMPYCARKSGGCGPLVKRGGSKLIVISTGTTGALTVTLKLHIAGFPAASCAVQVTIVAPTGNVLPLGGLQATPGFGGQLSVAVGAV